MVRYTFTERFSASLNLLPTAVYDAFPAVLFGRLLVISLRLGIFESLHQRPQSPREIATSLQLPPPSVDNIIAPLTASGYLRRKGEKYYLAPQAKKWLVKASPQYLGNFLAYIEVLHGHWRYLEETLKRGSPEKKYTELFSEEEWETYALGMMDLARLILPHLLPKLTIPPHARKLLDFCGSHGLYSIELCKRYPRLQATIADLPAVLSTTERILREHTMHDRITTMPCDVTNTPLGPEAFDVVLAFNIVHGFNEEMNRKMLRAIAEVLNPGGIIYILDQLKEQHATGVGRLMPLMVGLNVLNEVGGAVYTFGEIRTLCTDAGLRNIELQRLSLPGVSLIRATKL